MCRDSLQIAAKMRLQSRPLKQLWSAGGSRKRAGLEDRTARELHLGPSTILFERYVDVNTTNPIFGVR